MIKKYITKQGDTWESIAYFQLQNEYLFPEIVKMNQKYREYVVLPAGLELTLPLVTNETVVQAPWIVEAEDIDFDEDEEV